MTSCHTFRRVHALPKQNLVVFTRGAPFDPYPRGRAGQAEIVEKLRVRVRDGLKVLIQRWGGYDTG